jgi:hypothetical protein
MLSWVRGTRIPTIDHVAVSISSVAYASTTVESVTTTNPQSAYTPSITHGSKQAVSNGSYVELV